MIGDVEVGLLPHLAAQLVFPVRTVVERIQFLDLQGQPYSPPVPDHHHRNETLFGPGDPWIMLHAGAEWEGFVVGARGGVTVPLGSTVPDPFRLGFLGLPHEHIQLGTGTFDPVAGLSVERAIGIVTLGAWTLERFVVGTNGYGYHAGNRYDFGEFAQSGVGLEGWVFSLGFDLHHEHAETWNGVTYGEGNVGRTDVLVDAAVTRIIGAGFSAVVGLKVPLFTDAGPVQISYPAILSLGLSWAS